MVGAERLGAFGSEARRGREGTGKVTEQMPRVAKDKGRIRPSMGLRSFEVSAGEDHGAEERLKLAVEVST